MAVSSLFWLTVQVAAFSVVGATMFLLVRRRGPSAAAACAATVLVLTLPLLLISLSPWPRWELPTKTYARTLPSPPLPVEALTGHLDDTPGFEIVTSPADAAQESALAALLRKANELLQTSAEPFPSSAAPTQFPWKIWLSWLIAVGVALGLTRLLIGLWAVRSFRSNSIPVQDKELLELVQTIEQQLRADNVRKHQGTSSHSTRFEIRETPRLRSAATIGWRRPMLLLPADWRTWTETERRVVIAHELAHVARHDYLFVLIARLATAIHFYQPLVLWLSRQLRVQQELAADTVAATITGSRQVYLTTLAQMALRADEQTIPWPARAFLPGTSLLVKRVTWLKKNKTQEEQVMNRRTRWMLAVTMVVVALFVGGVRGPNQSASVAKAAEPAASTPRDVAERDIAQNGFAPPEPVAPHAIGAAAQGEAVGGPDAPPLHSNKYIPADAKFVAVVSPSVLFKSPSAAKLFALFSSSGTFEQNFGGLTIADIADIQVVKNATAVDLNSFDRIIVRAAKSHDWKKTLEPANSPWEAKEFYGKTYYDRRLQPPGEPGFFYFPDESTLIAGKEEEIKRIIAGEAVMPLEGSGEFFHVPFGFQIKGSFVRHLASREEKRPGSIDTQIFGLVWPLIDHMETLVVYGALRPKNDKEVAAIAVLIHCDSEDNLPAVADTVKAVRTLTVNALDAHRKQWVASSDDHGLKPDAKQAVAAMLATTKTTLEEARIDSGAFNDGTKRVGFSLELELPPNLVSALLLPSVEEARQAAQQNQSINNMKMIALALHNHLSATKRFPPAAIRDKNGKPLLSWRVAILPYIEEAALYNEFHLDEPWDSEHNLKLLSKLPNIYRHPMDDPATKNASYFMATGKGMFGDSETGRTPKEITDGFSKTIMLVESKRDVPWTKPEDVEIDADPTKPLPKLGGFIKDRALVGFADGSVQPISTLADGKALHAFFTVAGHEPPDNKAIEPPPTARHLPAGDAALQPGRSAPAKAQSTNNMKQIMLGILNYEDKTKRLPANILGKNGKPLLSWRVLLLPEVEEGELYREFHLDEPWDSPHNIKLILKIPSVYRNPLQHQNNTNSAYYFPMGKGAFGNAVQLAALSDGTANTIALVEAKRDIPWTKPEDIEVEIDPTKPLPKFGGFLEGQFNAGFADGHVISASDSVDAAILRPFFTINGRESVNEAVLMPAQD